MLASVAASAQNMQITPISATYTTSPVIKFKVGGFETLLGFFYFVSHKSFFCCIHRIDKKYVFVSKLFCVYLQVIYRKYL
jgi:hypothetical protein